ncbi:hypothetical protein P20439_0493 [Pseudoalteromonas sp. BSi20439]|nr:hypothetical protein P20439_0493 [Pseudoalteromonas sp. BSi20439]
MQCVRRICHEKALKTYLLVIKRRDFSTANIFRHLLKHL